MILPKKDEILKSPMHFLRNNAKNITFEDIIAQSDVNPTLLLVLLTLCRTIVATAKPFSPTSKFKEHQDEEGYRREVYKYGKSMNFYVDFLYTLHPVHVGEMIQILLKRLLSMGIDASSKVPQGSDLVQ